MASRRETAQRRHALAQELHRLTNRRNSLPGELLPSTRELSERFGLSVPTVCVELNPFIENGSIVSVNGVGMFVGQLTPGTDHFVHVHPRSLTNEHVAHQYRSLAAGFEERASELGASTTSVTDEELSKLDPGVIASASGIFCWSLSKSIPWKELGVADQPFVVGAYLKGHERIEVPDGDSIAFDDYGGGKQAALHLIQQGHTRIAFLGIHSADSSYSPRWAKDRRSGWEDTMRQRCPDSPVIAVVPDATSAGEIGSGLKAARVLLPRLKEFTAVVGVDDHALVGLVQALTEAGTPVQDWPAMVGFEGMPELSRYSITSLRTPWAEAGAAAAQALWDRLSGRLSGPFTEISVEFKLISRIALHGELGEPAGGTRLIHT